MNIAETRWYDLGRFKILQQPLATNPYWPTHRVFLKGKEVGRQLSAPCVDDCERMANPPPEIVSTYDYANARRSSIKVRKGGRPTKAEQERREATLLTSIPE